jgi:hypothetical protein
MFFDDYLLNTNNELGHNFILNHLLSFFNKRKDTKRTVIGMVHDDFFLKNQFPTYLIDFFNHKSICKNLE